MIASSGCIGAGLRRPDSFTKLHLRMNGEGNAFKDLTGKTITANGGVTQNSINSKFIGNSAYFDGNGDYLTVPVIESITGDFTFEVTAKALNLATTTPDTLFYRATDSGQAVGWFGVYWRSNKITLVLYNGSAWLGTDYPYSFGNDTWYHIAIVRSSGIFRCYVNGNEIGTGYSYTQYIYSPYGYYVGRAAIETNYDHNGPMSELRLSSIARHTAAFTPPTRRQ